MKVERLNCLVLNKSWEPLDIIPSMEALILVYKGKATLIEEHEELSFRSPTQSVRAPIKIALNTYVKVPSNSKPANLTNSNLFARDKYTCQYCLTTEKELRRGVFLTKDHIFPKSRGGKDSWINLITCCSNCNNLKDNKTPEEAGLILKKKPHVPTKYEIWRRTFENRMQKFNKNYGV